MYFYFLVCSWSPSGFFMAISSGHHELFDYHLKKVNKFKAHLLTIFSWQLFQIQLILRRWFRVCRTQQRRRRRKLRPPKLPSTACHRISAASPRRKRIRREQGRSSGFQSKHLYHRVRAVRRLYQVRSTEEGNRSDRCEGNLWRGIVCRERTV